MNAPSSDRLVHDRRFLAAAPWLRWGLFLLIAGYLLFSPLGCHGDEDNELFASLTRAARPADQGR